MSQASVLATATLKSSKCYCFCFVLGFFFFFLVALGLHYSARVPHCSGFSCCGAQAVGMWASVVVTHGLSCSMACEIFQEDLGWNPYALYWQGESYALYHQGSCGFCRCCCCCFYVDSSVSMSSSCSDSNPISVLQNHLSDKFLVIFFFFVGHTVWHEGS